MSTTEETIKAMNIVASETKKTGAVASKTEKKEVQFDDERLLLRPSRAFQIADVPRSTGYLLIRTGEWKSIRIGKAIRIPASEIQNWIQRKLAEAEENHA